VFLGDDMQGSKLRWLQFALVCTFGACFVLLQPNDALAFSFEEAEKLDKIEGGELLSRARDAANSGQFSSARSFINQARSKGAAPAQIRAAEAVLAKAEAKAEEARQQELARAQAAAASASASNQGGSAPRGNGKDWVSIEAECVSGGYCTAKDLSISGPGRFELGYNRAGRGAIHKGPGGGLVGNYRYSYLIESSARRCVASGSFTVDGTQGNIKIAHYPPGLNCNLSGVSGF
jgi:hypothetical protein